MATHVISYIADWAWGGHGPTSIISPDYCVESLPFLHKECFTTILTKLIGLAMICGAFLNKSPIFLNIYRTKTTAGIAASSVYGEIIMYSNSAFYGILQQNPFTSWGENGTMILQSIAIAALLWKYDTTIGSTHKMIAVGAYATYVTLVFTVLPKSLYSLLLTANWPALLIARGSLILAFSRLRHTGSQSIITTFMNMIGSLIRIFTTLKEIGWDMALLAGYSFSVVLNVILLAQFIAYRDNTEKFVRELGKKDKKA